MSQQYDDPYDEEEEVNESPDLEKEVKAQRAHIRKLQKDMAEYEELKKFKADYDAKARQESLTSVFTEIGLNPAHAKFFALENPETEPSKDAVAKWAQENGFAEQPEGEPASTFTPVTTSDGFAPGAKKISREEWLKISASDPEEGARLYAQNRVDMGNLRVGLGPDFET